MRRVAIGLGCAALGYALSGVLGYGAVMLLSANTHDREIEAAMNAAFVSGPLGALSAIVAATPATRDRDGSAASRRAGRR